jgi:hypothetical protein
LGLNILFFKEGNLKKLKKRGIVYNTTTDVNVKAAIMSAEVGPSTTVADLIEAGRDVEPYQFYYATKRDEEGDYRVKKVKPPHTPGRKYLFLLI